MMILLILIESYFINPNFVFYAQLYWPQLLLAAYLPLLVSADLRDLVAVNHLESFYVKVLPWQFLCRWPTMLSSLIPRVILEFRYEMQIEASYYRFEQNSSLHEKYCS